VKDADWLALTIKRLTKSSRHAPPARAVESV